MPNLSSCCFSWVAVYRFRHCMYWKYNEKKKKSEFIHSGGGLIGISTFTFSWIHIYRFVGPGSSKDVKPYKA